MATHLVDNGFIPQMWDATVYRTLEDNLVAKKICKMQPITAPKGIKFLILSFVLSSTQSLIMIRDNSELFLKSRFQSISFKIDGIKDYDKDNEGDYVKIIEIKKFHFSWESKIDLQ